MKHLDYRIEILTNDHAVGWVFLRDAPESHVSVDIFIGDKLLGTATANRYREDLARGGIGSGDHGFDFKFPGRLGDSALNQIRFMETTTGRELKSPRKKTKDVVSSRSAENGSTIYKKTKAELKGLIKSALAANYSSYSCKDGILTGNSYQTISLGGESVGGFRTARDEVIQLLQLEGRTVLDLGCNLG